MNDVKDQAAKLDAARQAVIDCFGGLTLGEVLCVTSFAVAQAIEASELDCKGDVSAAKLEELEAQAIVKFCFGIVTAKKALRALRARPEDKGFAA